MISRTYMLRAISISLFDHPYGLNRVILLLMETVFRFKSASFVGCWNTLYMAEWSEIVNFSNIEEVPNNCGLYTSSEYNRKLLLNIYYYITETTRCTFWVLFLTITSTCFEQANYSSSVGNLICSVWYVKCIHIDWLFSWWRWN